MKLNAKTIRLGAAALLAVVLVILLAGDLFGDSSGEEETGRGGNAVALSEPQLLMRTARMEQRVFWLGLRPGVDRYELSTAPGGVVFVRYLTGNAKAGDPRPDFVTVGTYPVPDARRALRQAKASEGGAISKRGGFEMLVRPRSDSVYVVFYDEPELQIEIFSPVPGEARKLAAAGVMRYLN